MHQSSVGVMVARFQVPTFHEGHRHILRYVAERHQKILVILGVPRSLPSSRDPLDFRTRAEMVRTFCPRARILPLSDCRSNSLWSERLDMLIQAIYPREKVVLYGSRDSFLSYYTGTYTTCRVEEVSSPSGTAVREEIANGFHNSIDFRLGVVYATGKQIPLSYQTVDTAVVRPLSREILLAGKREDEGLLRFIGGFVDPGDPSLEFAAKREVIEETGHVEVDDFHYLGSFRIDDWRYRNVPDKIMSAFFVATYIFGAPQASDDIDILKWVAYEKISEVVVPEHQPLAVALGMYLENNGR